MKYAKHFINQSQYTYIVEAIRSEFPPQQLATARLNAQSDYHDFQ